MWLGKAVNLAAYWLGSSDDVILHIQTERTIVYTAAADGIAIKAQALQTLALGRRHLRQRFAVIQTHLLKQLRLLWPLGNQYRAQAIAGVLPLYAQKARVHAVQNLLQIARRFSLHRHQIAVLLAYQHPCAFMLGKLGFGCAYRHELVF